MVNGFEHMKKFSSAARTLMEAGFVDAAAGKFSKTLFMSVTRRASEVEACALASALEMGWSLVTLEFGKNSKAKGPLCFSVSRVNGADGAEITHDCALTTDVEGRYVLVPRGAIAATFHFAIGPNGLERRHGRPPNIVANSIKAMRNLAVAAREASADSCIEVHTFESDAAAA